MWQDLIINLTAETLGIIVTLFMINRLVKRRDQSQRLPSQHLIYANLLKITGSLLSDVLPSRFQETTDETYHYGDAIGFPVIILKDIEPSELFLAELLIYISRDINSQKKLDIGPLSSAKKQFEKLLRSPAFLLNPELLTMLLKLHRSLAFLVRTDCDRSAEYWESEASRRQLFIRFASMISEAVELRIWLERRADQLVTVRDKLRTVQKLVAELEKIG